MDKNKTDKNESTGIYQQIEIKIDTILKFKDVIDAESDEAVKDITNAVFSLTNDIVHLIAQLPEEDQTNRHIAVFIKFWNGKCCKELQEACDVFNTTRYRAGTVFAIAARIKTLERHLEAVVKTIRSNNKEK